MTTYQFAAEEIINSTPDQERAKLQIGHIIDRALLLRDNGWHSFYMEELKDAADYANGEGLHEIIEMITKIIFEKKVKNE